MVALVATVLPARGAASETGADRAPDAATEDEVFYPAGALEIGRFGHTATGLGDGRVLVAGGAFGLIAEVEIWDPATASFSPGGSLTDGREDHTATLLPDGRVLLAGGSAGSGPRASVEAWDDQTGRGRAARFAGRRAGRTYGHAAARWQGALRGR